MNINTDAFSHGQIVSKVWLCEQLEPYLKPQTSLFILGGWYNVLGFMLIVRRPDYYKTIYNLDADMLAIRVANKITNAWDNVVNLLTDVNEPPWTLASDDVVISCSVEHFSDQTWFNKIPKGTLCCIQSCDVTDPDKPWLIKQPNPDIQTFADRFPMTETLFLSTKRIQYYHFGYNRFMLIGRK